MKILIIEDVVINIRLLEKILNDYGSCDSVRSGKDGLQLFKAAQKKNKPYDLICLDIFMPGISGFEVLQQIRQIDKGLKKVKIIMTTSSDEEEDVIKAIRYGCDSYMLKPYNKKDIEEKLIQFGLFKPDVVDKDSKEKEGE
ncbi:MAG: response regulator [Calditrichaeota bacterium]|nr:MAG: response regulator [Calditrichota bacterium]MBL1207916.1 response regulator [Calditrichota bacterium]NOG47751.1 response regulator [Calditrichota bacterium]